MIEGLADPLLEDVERPSSPPNVPLGRRTLIFSTICFTLFYVLLGAIERVSFARMASSMPSGVLLMHTLLAVMSLLLFVVLQLVRTAQLGQRAVPGGQAPRWQKRDQHLPPARREAAFLGLRQRGAIVFLRPMLGS